MKQTFGEFVRKERLDRMIKLNAFAAQIGISNVYLSYIETGKRPAPSKPILQRIENALNLSGDEASLMYSLASTSHNKLDLSNDLIDYINSRPYVMKTLHVAYEHNAREDEWEAFQRMVELRMQYTNNQK